MAGALHTMPCGSESPGTGPDCGRTSGSTGARTSSDRSWPPSFARAVSSSDSPSIGVERSLAVAAVTLCCVLAASPSGNGGSGSVLRGGAPFPRPSPPVRAGSISGDLISSLGRRCASEASGPELKRRSQSENSAPSSSGLRALHSGGTDVLRFRALIRNAIRVATPGL